MLSHQAPPYLTTCGAHNSLKLTLWGGKSHLGQRLVEAIPMTVGGIHFSRLMGGWEYAACIAGGHHRGASVHPCERQTVHVSVPAHHGGEQARQCRLMVLLMVVSDGARLMVATAPTVSTVAVLAMPTDGGNGKYIGAYTTPHDSSATLAKPPSLSNLVSFFHNT